jgi:pectate lyase
VGGYNDDGTPKSNAQIIYVTESTKNTVSAKIGSTTRTGIANILKNLGDSKVPVIIRVVGRITAATWNKIEYKTTSTTQITPDKVVGINGVALSKNNWTQADLIAGGYNTLNTTKYSELIGLSSNIKYDSSKDEFDSCWNNCSIQNASNVTLEGIGTDAEIFQWGLTWGKCNNIEVRNITFDDYTEDACSFEGSTNSTTVDGFNSQRLWVHNCTFNEGINYWDVCNEQDKHEGDGATDFKKCSYVTISYNHYYKNHKTGLIGGGDSQTTANVTFHHNFYDSCVSRLPLSRQANMHMYNNYYYNSTGTNMSIRAGGYAFIENCYFENANIPIETKTGDSKRGVAKIYGCVFVGKNLSTTDTNLHVVTDRTESVDNDNIFNKTFDTDSSAFYYNSTTKKTEVTYLSSATQAKTDCKAKAGVLK